MKIKQHAVGSILVSLILATESISILDNVIERRDPALATPTLRIVGLILDLLIGILDPELASSISLLAVSIELSSSRFYK